MTGKLKNAPPPLCHSRAERVRFVRFYEGENMTAIHRLRVSWTGTPVVGPGLSTFYSLSSIDVNELTTLTAFFGGIASAVPVGVQWLVPSSGDTFEVETGTLTGQWSVPGGGGPVNSQGDTAFVNGVGARILWSTNGFTPRGRVVGSTFVVPLGQNSYEGAGNLTAAAVTDLQNAGNAFVTSSAGAFAIWHRPTQAAPAGGSAHPILSATAPDKVSWLRSRRT